MTFFFFTVARGVNVNLLVVVTKLMRSVLTKPSAGVAVATVARRVGAVAGAGDAGKIQSA